MIFTIKYVLIITQGIYKKNISFQNDIIQKMKKCNYCNENIDLDSSYCSFCGAEQKADKIEYSHGIFIKKDNKLGEAFCIGCRKIDFKKNLYYCEKRDIYLHYDCLKNYY